MLEMELEFEGQRWKVLKLQRRKTACFWKTERDPRHLNSLSSVAGSPLIIFNRFQGFFLKYISGLKKFLSSYFNGFAYKLKGKNISIKNILNLFEFEDRSLDSEAKAISIPHGRSHFDHRTSPSREIPFSKDIGAWKLLGRQNRFLK